MMLSLSLHRKVSVVRPAYGAACPALSRNPRPGSSHLRSRLVVSCIGDDMVQLDVVSCCGERVGSVAAAASSPANSVWPAVATRAADFHQVPIGDIAFVGVRTADNRLLSHDETTVLQVGEVNAMGGAWVVAPPAPAGATPRTLMAMVGELQHQQGQLQRRLGKIEKRLYFPACVRQLLSLGANRVRALDGPSSSKPFDVVTKLEERWLKLLASDKNPAGFTQAEYELLFLTGPGSLKGAGHEAVHDNLSRADQAAGVQALRSQPAVYASLCKIFRFVHGVDVADAMKEEEEEEDEAA